MTYPSETRKRKHEYYLAHKKRYKQQGRKRYLKNREAILAQSKEYAETHKDECLARKRRYYKKNKEKARGWVRAWHKRHPGVEQKRRKRRAAELRKETIAAYGNKCACCGEVSIEFLSIDHINGKGSIHRKKIGRKGGHNFYRWLRMNDWPKGYQVLCFNCNCAMGFFGYCPHNHRSVPDRVSI